MQALTTTGKLFKQFIQFLREQGCGFHADSDTHSTRIRTVIPR
ncbi:hypothetical protein PshuTeo1_57210 (plasmid) [Pseudomonas hunanensis]|nr:hypothetical protein PshuTeo1_57210 [Pseudomonas hunanensis]